MDVEYEREWCYVVDDNKKYYLDFAIFCKNGQIDIECDGDQYHMGNENVHYDKTRNNELESYKWSVLRYTMQHFNKERLHIKKTIWKTINQYGGTLKIGEPDAIYYPKTNPYGQTSLF
jgi:REase_MTES_1575